MTDSVLQLIEREINGAQGLMYMEASAPRAVKAL
jgi:multidrug efflux pump